MRPACSDQNPMNKQGDDLLESDVKSAGQYDERFTVRAYEADGRGRATAVALANYLQEVASAHAMQLGIAGEPLLARQATWVLFELGIRIEEPPHWLSSVDVHTYPSGSDPRSGTREYVVRAADGSVAAVGSSRWMMMHVVRRRPIKIPPDILALRPIKSTRQLEDVAWPETFEGTPLAPWHITAVPSDIDPNGHVNHTRYLAWVLDHALLRLEEAPRLRAYEIRLRYLAEVNAGDALEARLLLATNAQGGTRTYHELVNADGRPALRGWIDWVTVT